MKNSKPVVSVILPVVNSQAYIKECLQSLLKQSYKALEIIAIDDFSKDKTFEIIKLVSRKDKRLRVFKNKKRYGFSVCLNRARKKVRGTFVTFADAKEIQQKDKIKKQVEFLTLNPKVVAVGTQCYFIDKKSKRIGKSSFPAESALIAKDLLTASTMQFETVMINTSLIPRDALKFLPHSYPLLYADTLLNLLNFGEFANLPGYLCSHRLIKTPGELDLITSRIKLWFKSKALYDFQPSLRSLFVSPSLDISKK